jgi:hypothetical protein
VTLSSPQKSTSFCEENRRDVLTLNQEVADSIPAALTNKIKWLVTHPDTADSEKLGMGSNRADFRLRIPTLPAPQPRLSASDFNITCWLSCFPAFADGFLASQPFTPVRPLPTLAAPVHQFAVRFQDAPRIQTGRMWRVILFVLGRGCGTSCATGREAHRGRGTARGRSRPRSPRDRTKGEAWQSALSLRRDILRYDAVDPLFTWLRSKSHAPSGAASRLPPLRTRWSPHVCAGASQAPEPALSPPGGTCLMIAS